MAAKMEYIQSDNGKFLTDQVNRLIKNYESGQVSVQIVTTVVADPRMQGSSKLIYEAYVIHPA